MSSSTVVRGGSSSSPMRNLRSHRGSTTRNFATPHFSADELDAMIETFVQDDNVHKKTLSRRVVENILQKFKWYFPLKDKPNAPSLVKAWAYYEHVTLPRYIVDERLTGDRRPRADPGEVKGTELYDPLRTSEGDIGSEFGIGVGLYFFTLRFMALILLIAGLINIASISYYARSDYSGPHGQASLFFTRRGTAICTRQEWVVCSDCTTNQFPSFEEKERLALTDDGLLLVLRNDCNGANLSHGIVNWVTLIFLVVSIGLLSHYLNLLEVRLDEDKSTAVDYTVAVKNPPPDALDPDQWRDFFSQFGEKHVVTVVTVAINNEEMLSKLVYRRLHRDNLQRILPKTTDLDNEDAARAAVDAYCRERDSEPKGCIMCLLELTILPILRLFNIFLKAESLVDKIFTLTKEIKELQQHKYEASKVFVTFETEEGQRTALTALAASKIDIKRNNVANKPSNVLFHGKLLKVSQPTEPSATRWLDLSANFKDRVSWRLLNLLVTCGTVAVAGYIVARVRNSVGPSISGPLVTIFNATVPLVVKVLMLFERHAAEGDWQNSLYLKITLFRWFNTAILAQIITPFTSTIGSAKTDVIPTIDGILWAELWLSPAIRILDPISNIKKHVIAPRSRNQEVMNMNFSGTVYNLGERYTDFSKVLFLCFYYSALFPSSFFFCAAILLLQYVTDKFCLLRIWAWAPYIGSELAVFSRRYLFSTALLAFAVVSSYAWAQFPYDNVCDDPNRVKDFAGYYNATIIKTGVRETYHVVSETPVVFCDQGWRHFKGFFFPALPSRQHIKWMTESQERLSRLYGWTSVIALVVWISIISGGAVTKYVLSFFKGVYKARDVDQQIDFSSISDIAAYVPQVKLKSFSFPFLACNIDDLDKSLIGWQDPNRDYDYFNLLFDVPFEGMPRKRKKDRSEAWDEVSGAGEDAIEQELDTKERSAPLFSIIKYYPPPWKVALTKEHGRAVSSY